MNTFTYSYPTKVYFGEGAAAGALRQELAGVKTVLLAYGGGSVRKKRDLRRNHRGAGGDGHPDRRLFRRHAQPHL